MKFNITHLLTKSGKAVALSKIEREHLHGVVTEYMAMKPRRELKREVTRRLGSFLFYGRKAVALGLLLTMIFSGTGISYAAEGAVPGDILYPVKVSVNEEIVSAFAVSKESKANWEAERAGRRLEEASRLAYEGKLTSHVAEDLAQRFERHADDAAAELEIIEGDDAPLALNLSQNFETNLSAHEELLHELDRGEVKIAEKIRKKVERVSLVRSRSEGKLSFASRGKAKENDYGMQVVATLAAPVQRTQMFAESTSTSSDDGRQKATSRMRSMAEKSLSRVKTLHARALTRLSADQRMAVDLQLTDAENLINEGDTFLSGDNVSSAFRSFQESASISQTLDIYLRAGQRVSRVEHEFPLPVFGGRRGMNDDSLNNEDKRDSGIEIEQSVEAGEDARDGRTNSGEDSTISDDSSTSGKDSDR